MAISLLDSLIIQMQDGFSDEDRHTRHLLYLSWLITPWSYLKQQKACCSGRMTFHFPNPFEMSCEDGKLCGSQQRRDFQAIFYSHLARVTRMLFQTSIVFFSLHVPYQSVLRKPSGPFAHEMDQDEHQINDM